MSMEGMKIPRKSKVSFKEGFWLFLDPIERIIKLQSRLNQENLPSDWMMVVKFSFIL